MRMRPSQSSVMKGKVEIDLLADHAEVDAVALGDARPVVDAGAAQRIDAETQAGGADGVEIEHGAEIGGVGLEEIVLVHRRRPPGLRVGQALHGPQPLGQQAICLLLDPAGDVAVGRAAVRRIVLEAAVLRRIVRRRDDDAVGQSAAAPLVVDEDRLGQRRRRRVFAACRDQHLDAVGRQHLEGALEGGLRQRMGVAADEQRSVRAGLPAPVADRLADCQHMGLVEAPRKGRAAMARGAESHALRCHGGIGREGAVGVEQLAGVDELLRGRQLARPGIDAGIFVIAGQGSLPLSYATLTCGSPPGNRLGGASRVQQGTTE